ncbi:43kDa postsynaptic protein [Trema orientale]|uniref:RING-type E3 ubiquitin transferase n=1 Tax=Trema orientale TaxID=63057 RepID=A0A2P5CSR8_TREOI|nr:43kDa postsynaptic protein [Trema orientale]
MASSDPNCWSSQVHVYAEDTHSRDQRHASPTLTFVFNVVRRYQSDTHMDTFESDHDSTHEFNCPLDLFRSSTPSTVSDGVVSGMLDAVDVPFLLENIFWGSRPPSRRRRLPNRDGGWIHTSLRCKDDMVGKISEFACRMVRSGSVSGRTGFRMRVTIENRVFLVIPLPVPSMISESESEEEEEEESSWIGDHERANNIIEVRSEQRAIEEYASWFGDERAIIGMLEQQATYTERYLSWFGDEGDIERVMRESEAEAAAMFRVAPAAKASVEALEKVGYDDVVSLEVLTCVVCLEELKGRSQLTRMPCSHLFHGECIEKWLQNHHSCPICRFELPIEIN